MRKGNKPVPVKKDGWSHWQAPIMKGYLIKCCGCGLVHEMEFAVVKGSKPNKQGWVKGEEVEGGRVLMRARRALTTGHDIEGEKP